MHQRGITLIEIVIALALVGMLLVLGLPAMSGMLTNIRVRAVAEDVVGALQSARAEAMKRNQNVTFNVDQMVGGGWSVVQDSDQSVILSKPAVVGTSVQLDSDLDSFASFNGFGLRVAPVGGDLTFTVSNPAAGDCQPLGVVRCMSIIVRSGGQIRLCDPQRPVGDPQACSF